jgi:hypothetical protein
VAQLFSPRANTTGCLVLIGLALVPALALAIHLLLMNSPYFTGEGNLPSQPIPFSHKHHVAEVGLDCRYCHFSVESSAIAGVPPSSICMSCHSQLWSRAVVLAPLRRSAATGSPLRWRQVNRLPGYVYFDHSVHIAKGVGCTTCHGAVDRMPMTSQGSKLTMEWCVSCHRNPGPYLREPADIFATNWQPNHDREEVRHLLARYLIRKTHLTDCSTCHR